MIQCSLRIYGGNERYRAMDRLEHILPRVDVDQFHSGLRAYVSMVTLFKVAQGAGKSRQEKSNMSETLDVNMTSRRQALSLFGVAAALIPAMALSASNAEAQTPGMERREERRDERQERREDRRENRQERRDDRQERREERRGLNDETHEIIKDAAPK
jgi:hypothetical protein